MGDLELGDRVATWNSHGIFYSEFIGSIQALYSEWDFIHSFLTRKQIPSPTIETNSGEVLGSVHEEEFALTRFNRILLENGAWLEITDNHLVFTAKSPMEGIQAKEIGIDDALFSHDKETDKVALFNVTSISQVYREGFYMPITREGTVFAGDILISSYGTRGFLHKHSTAHLMAFPVRVIYTLGLLRDNLLDGTILAVFDTIANAIGLQLDE